MARHISVQVEALRLSTLGRHRVPLFGEEPEPKRSGEINHGVSHLPGLLLLAGLSAVFLLSTEEITSFVNSLLLIEFGLESLQSVFSTLSSIWMFLLNSIVRLFAL